MCGVAGFLDLDFQKKGRDLNAAIAGMARSLYHRGPDDYGVWCDQNIGIALGHSRLSVIDLSPHGHQPMSSASGRYIITYNGEIYNYTVIREELERTGSAPVWRGASDTEVVLAAIELWGVPDAVKRLAGMFAFALWDKEDKILYLVRDRLGEKPLYYGWINNTFLFASELKALRAYPSLHFEVNRDALALFLRHNYIPTPYSIYMNINKLFPGTVLSLSRDQSNSRSYTVTPYWSAREVAERGIRDPFRGTEDDAIVLLDTLLRDAVKQQTVADVPLGAFLSGGVDSSTIVALMQAQSRQPVKTFTIGFNTDEYNEAFYARAIAKHLGTDHTELYVTPEDALTVIPKLPVIYDEPFSDSSQIPTYLVSQMARRKVTVSLSGDGGDELFGGYNRYFWGQKILRFRRIPGWIRWGAASLVRSTSSIGDKLHKMAEIISFRDPEDMYYGLVSHWKSPEDIVIDGHEPPTGLTDRNNRPQLSDFIRNMMFLDLVTYLPDDILVKVDRAAMGVGLESRMPFLDHRVVEFAWSLPLSMKIRNGRGKWVLRQVLYKYIPKELIERPKMGFGVPIDAWLRGPLQDWAENLLDEGRLRSEGFFNSRPIREKWAEHLSGRRNWHYYLWDILMFQQWLEAQKI